METFRASCGLAVRIEESAAFWNTRDRKLALLAPEAVSSNWSVGLCRVPGWPSEFQTLQSLPKELWFFLTSLTRRQTFFLLFPIIVRTFQLDIPWGNKNLPFVLFISMVNFLWRCARILIEIWLTYTQEMKQWFHLGSISETCPFKYECLSTDSQYSPRSKGTRAEMFCQDSWGRLLLPFKSKEIPGQATEISLCHTIVWDLIKMAGELGEWLDLWTFRVRTWYILMYIKLRINFQYDGKS